MCTDNSTPETVTIPLTKGFITIIDVIDADLAAYKWYAIAKNESAYARRRKSKNFSVSLQCEDSEIQHLHRLIMARVIGRSLTKIEQVDHINGDKLDNRRRNLRLANSSNNLSNVGKRKNNTSGFKGVYYNRKAKAWVASIKLMGRSIFLGNFDTPEKAHAAYCEAAKKYHGEFANFG